MIRYSTCRACGDMVQVTDDGQDVHPLCDPVAAKPPPTMMAAACWYAGMGWPVFPLLNEGEIVPSTGEPSTGKQPATRHGFKDATCDLVQVVDWWTQTPNRNIGLATGVRFDVIDIDPLGLPVLEQFRQRSDRAVHGWVDTPRGGAHLYVLPTGRRNSATPQGVDWRGEGGYVVAPPSAVAKGGWRWHDLPSPVITGVGNTFGVGSLSV